MMLFWCILLGLPVAACGCLAAVSPERATRFFDWFKESRGAAWVLAAVAWFWTAYECDTIGIAAFDRFTKAFPGELWILAAVLTWLVAIWMPKNLPVRALCGILMLLPGELFKTIKPFRPEQGVAFALPDIVIYAAYAGAIAGMYGMFYPWRIEKAVALALNKKTAARFSGAAAAIAGAAVVFTGAVLSLQACSN